VKQCRRSRNKNTSKNHLPPTSSFFPGSSLLPISLPPPSKWCRGMGNGGCSQFIVHCLCRSFLFMLFFCSNVSSHSQEIVLHELLWHGSFFMGCSYSQTAPAEVLSTGCRPSGTDRSNMGPPWGHKSCQQTCSSMGSSPWVLKSCQETAPSWGLHKGQNLLRVHPLALVWGADGRLLHCRPPWAAGGQPTSPWSSPQVAGESLLQHLKHLVHLRLH